MLRNKRIYVCVREKDYYKDRKQMIAVEKESLRMRKEIVKKKWKER